MTDEPKTSIPNLLYKTDGSESFGREQAGASPKALDAVFEILVTEFSPDVGHHSEGSIRQIAKRVVAAVHDGT